MSRLYRQPLHGTDASSWVGRKLSRPTLDGMWGALEGRLTKFIAGEEIISAKQDSASSGDPVGAFTHYSAITPDMAGSLDALSRSDDDLDAQEQEQDQNQNQNQDQNQSQDNGQTNQQNDNGQDQNDNG